MRIHRQERGQVLVIVALAMVTVVAMVGVVIDGGYAWGKQRDTQNGSDATAEAGAVVLMQNVAGTSPAKTDADVLAAVNQAAADNGLGIPVAYYTDINGRLLNAAGNTVGSESAAARVGTLASGPPPDNAAGVRAIGQQTFDTFIARVVGITQFTARADATAVAGYLAGTCDADSGCIVLPVTFPVNVTNCDGSNNPYVVTPVHYWPAPSPGPVVVPLCSTGPGNVGWLDWTPTTGTPGCTGTGTSELSCVITSAANPYLFWPNWYFITATGNINAAQVESALRGYDGALVQIPQFDLTCDATPSGPGLSDCPLGHIGGNGTNQWYHLAAMTGFRLCSSTIPACSSAGFDHGAYVNGSNPICSTATTSGATSCLVGLFESSSYEGEVTAAPGPNPGAQTVGIQLIE